ncbi:MULTISPECIES: V-type ATPase subunit [unclassified Fusibacter]|uniref:V-type ATPase subunit n=1 Tax=unclassified Fusibacter TaxID=2624464 RepID=UPI0010105E78|nr:MULTISPECIES: V-type ATPase subunit [unclassified Fusibacter]MCK8059892.1 V-type ATPase subunit [Fusibacter sp. A2]NPE21694.1 V-type ATPase subunit [Fusibacter sp. A1]RXV62097.1 hypothetical protein DWB64_07605 [Fusibacter sp. A1]
MGSVTRFAALYTKVKSLESGLLTKEDYHTLINLKTEDEVIEYLVDNSIYGKLVKVKKYETDEAVNFERVLRRYVFSKYEQLIHYVTNEERKLFKLLLARYEIENLKLVIRSVLRQDTDKIDAQQLLVSKHFEFKDYPHLLESKNLEQVVDRLMGTHFGPLLKPFVNESNDRVLFYMEMTLDRLYFKRLADQMEKLAGEGKTFMLDLLGTNIDYLNIQWIYRGVKNFALTPEELFNYCLDDGKYLNLKKVKTLCYLPSYQVLIEELKNSKYRSLFMEESNMDLIMEREMERSLFELFSELSKKGKLNLVTPIGFLHKLEYELRDIFAIIEAKRYGLDAKQTSQFLVRTLE